MRRWIQSYYLVLVIKNEDKYLTAVSATCVLYLYTLFAISHDWPLHLPLCSVHCELDGVGIVQRTSHITDEQTGSGAAPSAPSAVEAQLRPLG